MILYHAVSSFQLLEFIVHRVTKEKENIAILMITTDIVKRYSNYEELCKNFFDEILIYDNYKSETLITDEQGFLDYFDYIFKKGNIDILNMKKIYISCCHAGFGLYVAKNNLPFIYFEDAAGALSHCEGIIEHIKKGNPYRANLIEKYGLHDGSCINAIKRIYNFSANGNLIRQNKDSDYNVAVELGNIQSFELEKIIKSFVKSEKLKVASKYTLVLTEHLYNLNMMTWDEQCMMYQLVIDYFLEDKSLVFKTHPDDLLYYKLLFPQSEVIREKFPAELLPYILGNVPEIVATISSTSIYGLKNLSRGTLIFNQEFSYFKHQFYDLNRFYVVLKLINELKINERRCFLDGVNECIVKNFINFRKDICNIRYEVFNKVFECPIKSALYIVDRTEIITDSYVRWLEKLDDEAIVFFLNTDSQYCFYDINYKHIWQNIIPIKIEKKKLRKEHTYINLESEMIYVYSKKGDLQMPDLNKELINTGVSISTSTFSDDKLRIMVLEGMLEATEKRLEYYIKKCEGE